MICVIVLTLNDWVIDILSELCVFTESALNIYKMK